MPATLPPNVPEEGPYSAMMGDEASTVQDLSEVARPSYEDEDIEILSGIKQMTQLAKTMMARSKSGPVDDVLSSILQKLTGLQKKYDQLLDESKQGGQ